MVFPFGLRGLSVMRLAPLGKHGMDVSQKPVPCNLHSSMDSTSIFMGASSPPSGLLLGTHFGIPLREDGGINSHTSARPPPGFSQSSFKLMCSFLMLHAHQILSPFSALSRPEQSVSCSMPIGFGTGTTGLEPPSDSDSDSSEPSSFISSNASCVWSTILLTILVFFSKALMLFSFEMTSPAKSFFLPCKSFIFFFISAIMASDSDLTLSSCDLKSLSLDRC